MPISDLCEEHGLQPSQIFRWQAAIFEHGADAFDLKKGRRTRAAESANDERIAKLEEVVAQKDTKIAQKNEVISELMEENIRWCNIRSVNRRWVPELKRWAIEVFLEVLTPPRRNLR